MIFKWKEGGDKEDPWDAGGFEFVVCWLFWDLLVFSLQRHTNVMVSDVGVDSE